MQSTVSTMPETADSANNVIVVAPCPVDQALNRSMGMLGNSHQFVCRKCKSMYAMTTMSGKSA